MSWLCPRCDATFVDRSGSCTACGVPLVDDMRGRVLAGRYRLESVVGTGSQDSAVWKGWQMSFERPVAVKIMPAGEAIAAERFSRGAKIASMLAHPNITTVHDYGVTDDGKVFLVMELLEGHVLRAELREGKPMPVDRALHIAGQVLRALEDAHAHSVVHRDLKPDNLFLTHRAGDPDFIKVLDFGIAKFFAAPPPDDGDATSTLDGQITRGWQLCGTPLYMAPEQISGEAVDGRTDIYALGIVLYQMLCGRVPFKAKTQYAVLSQHLRDPPPPFSEIRPEDNIPDVIEEIVRRALAKSRDDRFQTAREMRLALRDVQQMLGLKIELTDESDRRRQATLPAMQTMHGEPPPGTIQGPRWGMLLLVLLAMVIGAVGMHFGMGMLRSQPAGDVAELDDDGRATASDDDVEATAASVGQDDNEANPIGGEETDEGANVGGQDTPEVSTVQVSLTSIPAGATATAGGVELGITPVTVPLAAGERHEVTFASEGYVPANLNVDLTAAPPGATRAAAMRLTAVEAVEAVEEAPPTDPGAAAAAEPARPPASDATRSSRRGERASTSSRSSRAGSGTKNSKTSDASAARPAPAATKTPDSKEAAEPKEEAKAPADNKDAGQADTAAPPPKRIKLLGAGEGDGDGSTGGEATKTAATKPKIHLLDTDAPPEPRPERKKVNVQVLGD